MLLAPGGAGKSTLIEALKRREPASQSIDLRMHSTQSLIATFDQLSSGESASTSSPQVTVFIDAIDEALQVDPNIGHVLVRLLSRPEMSKLAWRFACRPASWSRALADGMHAALPGFEELELLPLGIPDIRAMAADDADAFINQVEQAGLNRLLALPLHASNLLDAWRHSGQLPANRSVAMQHAVNRMLSEGSTTRLPGQLDDQRCQLIAERLAAFSMFCSVGSFSLQHAGGVTPGPLAVSAVPTHAEPDLAGAALTVPDIQEVLGTSLFAAAGQGAVAFAHQSYTEYLAAAYLRRRGVAGQRLITLLGADVNGLVPGPMIEVLGWLLAKGAPVPDVLMAENARQLLNTAGLQFANDQTRRSLVQALLNGAASGLFEGPPRADTSILSHPELAVQLQAAASNVANPWVAFWICRIARQCAVHEVADDLLALALEPSLPAMIRAEAVTAFAAVTADHRKAELAPLLELDTTQDPYDEIRAAALRAVLPNALDFDRIRNAIRPTTNSHFIGDYERLLSELPGLIPSVEVLPTLNDALRRRPEHGGRAFDDLIRELLQRAWDARDPSTAEAIGSALASDRFGRQAGLPWQTDDDPDLRRTIAAAALGAHEHAFMAVLGLGILTPSDLGWLIDWMPTAPAEALTCAGVVARNLAWNVADAASADRILSMDEDHPAYEDLKSFRGHQDIKSRPPFPSQTDSADSESKAEATSTLRAALEHVCAVSGDWWHVFVALAGRDGGPSRYLDWDLTNRRLWSELSTQEQELLLLKGVEYLNARTPAVDRWAGQDVLQADNVIPDWAGAALVATLVMHRPELLGNVEDTAWTAWAPVITAMSHYSSEQSWLQELRSAVSQSAQDAVDAAMREQIRSMPAVSYAYHPLADFNDGRLLSIVEQIARATDESTARRAEALGVLVEHAPDVAVAVAKAAMGEHEVPPAAFAALAKLAPQDLFANWITQESLGPLELLRELDTEKLSNDSVVALTRLVLDELPFAQDPDELYDFAAETPAAAARRTRTRLLQSMASRGMANALIDLAKGRPVADTDRIRQLLQQARAYEAMTNWRPLAPVTLMELLDSGDARLIRDSAGLRTVLVEQLAHIQNDLPRGGFRSLWDGEPGDDNASPKSEDTISDWLVEQLKLRLKPHVVLDREIQVTRRKDAGVGTRIDITASSGGAQIARVPIEAKLVSNRELSTALPNQLVDKYMKPTELTDGLYMIYWVPLELRPKGWTKKHPDAGVLADELRAQAEQQLPSRYIDVVVLDIGPS
ncbi:hypothetical protein BOO86_21660 [Mycobacterium sp. CBMA 234]|uniref:NACHT domain-containing protein n=1 Tax=Mycolicibacterium sp. CBMA 234 TaxID=1918495 RepID=UPI0012DECD2D|nr:hypothetical protein [Mycolicibacterium sp. CBMA 234]MUL67095.1 hypothetical protein [Mycolicibacterium sp. CBMA 234]